MNDVGEAIPVGNVLGILRAENHAVPEFHVATFADDHAAHPPKYCRCDYYNRGGGGKVPEADGRGSG